MQEGKISPAQMRAQRRKLQGKLDEKIDFNYDINVPSLDEYYSLGLDEILIHDMAKIYDELNVSFMKEFLLKTKLEKNDMFFLLLAVALQCARQYLFTDFKDRVHHESTKKSDKKKADKLIEKYMVKENNTNKQGGYYYKKLEGIILDGVPYDVTFGIEKGKGGPNHRYHTLGHDPVIGWVVGPMNIMTNTLTTSSLESFHIRKRKNSIGLYKKAVYSAANNGKILDACFERLNNEPVSFAASIAKQAIHFRSDINTSKSLPIPFIQSISPELATKLAKYGLDMANIETVGKQVTSSILINTMVAIIHRMFYDEKSGLSEKLYKVKTRKILMYSNVIASSSNVLYVAFSKDIKKLDVGGILVTIYRIISDEKFIDNIMREFIDSSVSKEYDEKLRTAQIELSELLVDTGYSF